jgi:hypothetical protein
MESHLRDLQLQLSDTKLDIILDQGHKVHPV